MALTGRFNFRKTLTGKVVLQLEEDVKAWWPSRKRTKRRWRDANLMDLARPELRPLIDLRQKPNYQAQSYKLEELDLDEATTAAARRRTCAAQRQRPDLGPWIAHGRPPAEGGRTGFTGTRAFPGHMIYNACRDAEKARRVSRLVILV